MRRLSAIIRWGGLVCCVVIIALMIIDCFTTVYAGIDSQVGAYQALLWDGGVRLVWVESIPGATTHFDVEHRSPRIDLATWFSFGENHMDGVHIGYYLYIPLWFLLIIFVIPTMLMFWRARKRIPPGHCKKCGYNLTGSTSGMCPECGTGIEMAGGLKNNGAWAHRHSIGKAIFILSAYASVILLIQVVRPLHYRYHFPSVLDIALMLLAVSGSFHAAGHARMRMIYLLYGALAGFAFTQMILAGHHVGGMRYTGADDWSIARECAILVSIMMLACLYSAVLRHKLIEWRGTPSGHCRGCGYNLTGNVSGVCPECGEPVGELRSHS